MRTTNYRNTFISVADSCKKTVGTVPPQKTPPTIAQRKYAIISEHPYQYTSDEILLEIHRQRSGGEVDITTYNNTSQACFRCSPLAKTYGWGFHFNDDWKVAIYGVESEEYQRLLRESEAGSGLKERRAFSVKR